MKKVPFLPPGRSKNTPEFHYKPVKSHDSSEKKKKIQKIKNPPGIQRPPFLPGGKSVHSFNAYASRPAPDFKKKLVPTKSTFVPKTEIDDKSSQFKFSTKLLKTRKSKVLVEDSKSLKMAAISTPFVTKRAKSASQKSSVKSEKLDNLKNIMPNVSPISKSTSQKIARTYKNSSTSKLQSIAEGVVSIFSPNVDTKKVSKKRKRMTGGVGIKSSFNLKNSPVVIRPPYELRQRTTTPSYAEPSRRKSVLVTANITEKKTKILNSVQKVKRNVIFTDAPSLWDVSKLRSSSPVRSINPERKRTDSDNISWYCPPSPTDEFMTRRRMR